MAAGRLRPSSTVNHKTVTPRFFLNMSSWCKLKAAAGQQFAGAVREHASYILLSTSCLLTILRTQPTKLIFACLTHSLETKCIQSKHEKRTKLSISERRKACGAAGADSERRKARAAAGAGSERRKARAAAGADSERRKARAAAGAGSERRKARAAADVGSERHKARAGGERRKARAAAGSGSE
ncbi:unnamed protein product [Spodoptera exigua]|nr:unnamed protein product [Spodoptera exigua]